MSLSQSNDADELPPAKAKRFPARTPWADQSSSQEWRGNEEEAEPSECPSLNGSHDDEEPTGNRIAMIGGSDDEKAPKTKRVRKSDDDPVELEEGIIPGAANLRLWRFVGNRIARQAIQHGLKIDTNSVNGRNICDELINLEDMDEVINMRVKGFKNSGVVGACFNKRALTFGEETIDQFREYMSIYCHDQAYCHFSKELIQNLEKYWYNSQRKS